MFAELNHGRWIVPCPECPNAERAGELLRCSECGVSGRVVWPEDRAEIERLMVGRPVAAQSWVPGESVDVLAAENIEHGVSV